MQHHQTELKTNHTKYMPANYTATIVDKPKKLQTPCHIAHVISKGTALFLE